MKLKVLVFLSLFMVNAPWVLTWLYVTREPGAKPADLPVLFLLLVIGFVGLIILPCILVKNLLRRRWFLIAMLAFFNLYGMLSWIDAYAVSAMDIQTYHQARLAILYYMGLSSLAIILIYMIFDRVINFWKKREP